MSHARWVTTAVPLKYPAVSSYFQRRISCSKRQVWCVVENCNKVGMHLFSDSFSSSCVKTALVSRFSSQSHIKLCRICHQRMCFRCLHNICIYKKKRSEHLMPTRNPSVHPDGSIIFWPNGNMWWNIQVSGFSCHQLKNKKKGNNETRQNERVVSVQMETRTKWLWTCQKVSLLSGESKNKEKI